MEWFQYGCTDIFGIFSNTMRATPTSYHGQFYNGY